MSSYLIKVEVAKEIWNIAAKSSKYRNAVMDVIGEEAYQNVMKLQKEDVLFVPFKEEAQS